MTPAADNGPNRFRRSPARSARRQSARKGATTEHRRRHTPGDTIHDEQPTKTPHDTSAGQQDGTHFRKRPAVTVRPTRSPTGSRGTRSESRKRSGPSLPPEENLCFPYCIRRRRNAIRNSGSRAGELPGNYYMRKERPPVKLTSSRAGFQLTEAKIPNSSPASPSKRQLRPALKWTSCT